MTFHPKMPYETGLHQSARPRPDPGEPFAFTPERRARLEEIAAHYPPERRRSALLPALHLVQHQQGYVSARAMEHVAEVIGVTPIEVEDVVTFYEMFYSQPVGTYVLQVCRTLSCALNGAERVVDVLSRKLGIKPGETDASGMFTLMEVECLGACDRAPVVAVNEHWHELVTPESAERLVDDLRTRGLEALSGCHLCVERK
ncbi:MAG TPA: NADH-quinone oxidoreductase subunit NuoE [Vicinamibacterales bacterium]|nr:NADH-quinone oxidoreductase subunit NuoE [Vicinamibacterales bacterium]